jgi:thioredoxin 1
MSNIRAVTDATFNIEVLRADVPVLVDFWAPWCGPCKSMMPSVESIAAEFGDRVKVVKMNVDENSATPQAQGVRGIPAFMIFVDGAKVDSKVGAMTKAALESFVERHAPEADVPTQMSTTTTESFTSSVGGAVGDIGFIADVAIASAVIDVTESVFEAAADVIGSMFD